MGVWHDEETVTIPLQKVLQLFRSSSSSYTNEKGVDKLESV